MFSSHLKSLCQTCNIVFVRNVRVGRLKPSGPNPGLNKRITAFQKDGVPITDEDAEEFVEQSESDFYKVGEMYNEHLNETLMEKYELRHQIIKEKYFKINLPNLLTWSEKEQIRHLATTEPEEWTPERIAESFPVTVPVVKKFLQYAWKPATLQRIERHDASAMRNWKDLKEGSLDIPPKLREQFLKFSERTIPPLKKESIKVDLTQETKMGEFESIVNRCAAKQNDQRDNDFEHTTDARDSANNVEESVKNTKSNLKRMTLDELTAKINKRLEKGQEIHVPDQIIVNTVNTEQKTTMETVSSDLSDEIDLLYDDKNETSSLAVQEEQNNDKDIMDYPERIRIPKKAYKKGATYKVNDCFYDHDGKFLYRVLGL
ncbi:hypothetical protein K1T71_009240 [Dendrolimus kikuchii]|uniref:Uncharacterized protein n=1 Tax=Dendrolimus kikuchii TaxID=765133 RepID=A0ACC1CTW9_9NEOP|nr:hypothetical protein K1T71_009240 [Dendrolimus kikuchii]